MTTTAPAGRDASAGGETPRSGVHHLRTDALLLAMAVIWGANFSVLKYAVAWVPALAFNAMRVPLASAAQFAMARAMGKRPVTRSVAWHLLLLGSLGNGLYQALFITGLSRTRVATAALLIAASPGVIAIVGRALGREHFTPRQGLGVLLQMGGCASVAFGAANAAAGTDSFSGALLILGSTVCWAFYAVWLRSWTDTVDVVQLGAWTMLGGAVVMLALGGAGFVAIDFAALPAGVWAALAYSSLMAMVVAYLFYYRGLRVLGPMRTSMYANLQPLIAMIVAWIALREVPTAVQVIGGIFIVGGLLVARYAAEPAEA
ncbi:MAG: DMT family transporter [Gemmatimonadota bacterium]